MVSTPPLKSRDPPPVDVFDTFPYRSVTHSLTQYVTTWILEMHKHLKMYSAKSTKLYHKMCVLNQIIKNKFFEPSHLNSFYQSKNDSNHSSP